MNDLLTAAVLAAATAWGAGAGPRPPAGAGHFYPAKPSELAVLVDRQLAAGLSASLPRGAKVVALLVPHSGLEFSGPTAARAYAQVKKGDFDAVVVVGTSHYKELEGAALYPGSYATAAASMPYDEALARALLAGSPLIKADAAAHRKEHSVEVQLPYLRRVLGPVPVLGLIMNTEDLEASRQVGRAIAKAAAGRRVLLVASSDQSHFPSGGVADAVDRTTLLSLQAIDPAYFWLTNRFLMNRGLANLSVTYCGEGAVMAVLEAAKTLGADHARVLGRVNSGDVVSEREYNHVVGYAAAAFTREGSEPDAPLRLNAAEKKRLLGAAREAVVETVSGRTVSSPLSREARFNLPAAVTVTLRGKDGAARGRAAVEQPEDSLLEAVVRLSAKAASAGAQPRPVAPDEAPSLKLEITALARGGAPQTFGDE